MDQVTALAFRLQAGPSSTSSYSSEGRFRSHLEALVAAQLHHVASHAHARAGRCLEALTEAQRSLKIASSLFASRGPQGGSAAGDRPLSAGVEGGNVISDNGAAARTSAVGDAPLPGLVPDGAASSSLPLSGSTKASSFSTVSAYLSLPVLEQYLCSLLSSAAAFDSLGCSEDASLLLKECRELAASVGAAQLHCLSTLR